MCETAGKQASLSLRLTDSRTEEERRQNPKIQRNKHWARYRRFLSRLEIINTYRLDREIRGNQTTEDERWESRAVHKHIGQSSAAFIAGRGAFKKALRSNCCQSVTQGLWNISACVCISDRTCVCSLLLPVGTRGGDPHIHFIQKEAVKLVC